uniref:LYR motif containing 4 n=1 Tax=Scleropages formosus TaxID=113540 RepID=A0A8C9TF21_SCLFO
MAASSRSQVLSLYRMLLRESKKFPSYNYRTYALRRVKDAFRENKNVNDPKTVEILLNRARDNLSIIQRQVSPPEETRTSSFDERTISQNQPTNCITDGDKSEMHFVPLVCPAPLIPSFFVFLSVTRYVHDVFILPFKT